MQSNDSKCSDVVYDGTKRGEYIPHSLGDGDFVKYTFTVAEIGKTWTGPMPKSKGPPLECRVTIGMLAAGQLVRDGDGWVMQSAP